MDSIYDKLRKYLYERTRGLVRITEEDAAALVEIVKSNGAMVVLHKYNNQSNTYEKYKTWRVSDERLNELIVAHKDEPRIESFAKWEFYDSTNVIVTRLYNLNYHIL